MFLLSQKIAVLFVLDGLLNKNHVRLELHYSPYFSNIDAYLYVCKLDFIRFIVDSAGPTFLTE